MYWYVNILPSSYSAHFFSPKSSLPPPHSPPFPPAPPSPPPPPTLVTVYRRSDQLVPYKAVKWLEKALPSCTSEVILGGTHALLYDQGSMDEVFTALQKGVSEARVSQGTGGRHGEMCVLVFIIQYIMWWVGFC